nr:unnamed protein product [Digitaria exilis]
MSDFIVAAVGGAILQDIVSRTISFALGKRKEWASHGEYLQRVRKAVQEVEFMLERTAKLPITDVSLLRQKIELKRGRVSAQQQAQEAARDIASGSTFLLP